MDQHKDGTRRPDGIQDKKRVYRDNGLPVVTNKRSVLCPTAGPRTTQGTQKKDKDRQRQRAPTTPTTASRETTPTYRSITRSTFRSTITSILPLRFRSVESTRTQVCKYVSKSFRDRALGTTSCHCWVHLIGSRL